LDQSHALLDGWSQSLVLKQVFSAYKSLAGGEEPTLDPSPSYRNYIDWLAAQDYSEDERFWKQTLKGSRRRQGLATDRLSTGSHGEVVTHEELGLQFSVESTASCRALRGNTD